MAGNKNFILNLWLRTFCWMLLIFILSSIPNLKTALQEDFIIRKIAHVFEYSILTWFLFKSFKNSFHQNKTILYIYPILVSFLYACTDEYHQTFVKGRHGCFTDVLIDSIGILGFYLILTLWSLKTNRIAP